MMEGLATRTIERRELAVYTISQLCVISIVVNNDSYNLVPKSASHAR